MLCLLSFHRVLIHLCSLLSRRDLQLLPPVHAGDVPLNKLMEFEKFSLELKKDAAVQEMPVQSFITSPSAGDIIALVRKQQNGAGKDGKSDAAAEPALSVKVKGMAWSGGGEGIALCKCCAANGDFFGSVTATRIHTHLYHLILKVPPSPVL